MQKKNHHSRIISKLLSGFLILFLFLYFPVRFYAQVPTTSDCLGAFTVCNLTYEQSLSFSGTGNYPNEINNAFSCLGAGERNSSWYMITVQTSGLLGFNINPYCDIDYDWAVYNLTNATCADIFNNPALEVSCNYSGSIFPTPTTGANGGTNPDPGSNGFFPQEEPFIPVQAGETYALVVSNFTDNQCGFQLDFSLSTASIIDNVPPLVSGLTSPVNCGQNFINFEFTEFVRCNSVTTQRFKLEGPNGNIPVTGVTGVACINGGVFEKNYTVIINENLFTSGNYTLKVFGPVQDLCNNVLPDTQYVSFNISTFEINMSSTVVNCNLNNGSATANVVGGVPPYLYTWSNGLGGQTVNGLPIGWISVTVQDFAGCINSDSVFVADATGFNISNGSIADTCSSGLGTARVNVVGGTGPFLYQWFIPGAGNSAVVDSVVTGTYDVRVTDQGTGCQLTISVFVPDYRYNMTADFLVTPNPVPGLPTEVSFLNESTNASSYFWDFGDGSFSTSTNPRHIFIGSGEWPVTLVAFNPFGCTDTVVKIVTVEFLLNYFVPTAFTPNNDSRNEEFKIMVTGIADSTFVLDIYDRWGRTVFSSTDKNIGWNGKFQNGTKACPMDVYGYKVFFRDQNGRRHTKYGSVLLLN